MSALTSPKTYGVLAAVQAADAVACAIPLAAITKALDDVGLPQKYRPIIPVVKAASAIGLAAVGRYPALARLTTFMLTIYFTLAVGSHLRAKDYSPGLVAASSFLALFSTLTVRGPDTRR
ncbi:DoxX family protein [Mycobacterium sp. ACS4331]|uniref:DoxX family protein n=1 Tax=Mycobacterium sp. ACS4331 TaxID=1834121 RepID=UPI0008001199|nr:DoxX family protein [Mycobacterium sp. ACS4331]OBF11662.1 hypothetical protein A5727_19315 [Mycobacterium sp. ACS4331]